VSPIKTRSHKKTIVITTPQQKQATVLRKQNQVAQRQAQQQAAIVRQQQRKAAAVAHQASLALKSQQKAALDAARAKQAAIDKAAQQKVSLNAAAVRKAARDKAVLDKAASDKLAREQALQLQNSVDKAVRDKATLDKAARDKAASDKVTRDAKILAQAALDKAALDKAAHEKTVLDKAGAGKLALLTFITTNVTLVNTVHDEVVTNHSTFGIDTDVTDVKRFIDSNMHVSIANLRKNTTIPMTDMENNLTQLKGYDHEMVEFIRYKSLPDIMTISVFNTNTKPANDQYTFYKEWKVRSSVSIVYNGIVGKRFGDSHVMLNVTTHEMLVDPVLIHAVEEIKTELFPHMDIVKDMLVVDHGTLIDTFNALLVDGRKLIAASDAIKSTPKVIIPLLDVNVHTPKKFNLTNTLTLDDMNVLMHVVYVDVEGNDWELTDDFDVNTNTLPFHGELVIDTIDSIRQYEVITAAEAEFSNIDLMAKYNQLDDSRLVAYAKVIYSKYLSLDDKEKTMFLEISKKIGNEEPTVVDTIMNVIVPAMNNHSELVVDVSAYDQVATPFTEKESWDLMSTPTYRVLFDKYRTDPVTRGLLSILSTPVVIDKARISDDNVTNHFKKWLAVPRFGNFGTNNDLHVNLTYANVLSKMLTRGGKKPSKSFLTNGEYSEWMYGAIHAVSVPYTASGSTAFVKLQNTSAIHHVYNVFNGDKGIDFRLEDDKERDAYKLLVIYATLFPVAEWSATPGVAIMAVDSLKLRPDVPTPVSTPAPALVPTPAPALVSTPASTPKDVSSQIPPTGRVPVENVISVLGGDKAVVFDVNTATKDELIRFLKSHGERAQNNWKLDTLQGKAQNVLNGANPDDVGTVLSSVVGNTPVEYLTEAEIMNETKTKMLVAYITQNGGTVRPGDIRKPTVLKPLAISILNGGVAPTPAPTPAFDLTAYDPASQKIFIALSNVDETGGFIPYSQHPTDYYLKDWNGSDDATKAVLRSAYKKGKTWNPTNEDEAEHSIAAALSNAIGNKSEVSTTDELKALAKYLQIKATTKADMTLAIFEFYKKNT
jgi:hypothetical protein